MDFDRLLVYYSHTKQHQKPLRNYFLQFFPVLIVALPDHLDVVWFNNLRCFFLYCAVSIISTYDFTKSANISSIDFVFLIQIVFLTYILINLLLTKISYRLCDLLYRLFWFLNYIVIIRRICKYGIDYSRACSSCRQTCKLVH